ncbi:hypothetical protein BN871_AI_00580 [Paenibacillus sp. P22]|nr:hypothetical protein BN871_AI_00580 [Paenibacillus sp. P22]
MLFYYEPISIKVNSHYLGSLDFGCGIDPASDPPPDVFRLLSFPATFVSMKAYPFLESQVTVMNTQEPKVFRTAVEAALEAIGGKWKPVILFHLTFGMKRNGQLLRLIPDITQKVLTQQLRELQHSGIVRRISYDEIPPRVEYDLTGFGRTLEPLLHSMCLWGESYIRQAYGEAAIVLHSPDSRDDDSL